MFDTLAQIPVQERWRGQVYPLPIVGAIIRRDNPVDNSQNDYLLIQRVKSPYLGMWAIVGGKWDFGETMSDAILREVAEETGLETEFVGLRGIVNERLSTVDSVDGQPAHFIIFVCELRVRAGKAQEKAEGPVGWFSTAELQALQQKGQIIPSDYAMLQKFVVADALPFVEAEMVVDESDTPFLQRFEESHH